MYKTYVDQEHFLPAEALPRCVASKSCRQLHIYDKTGDRQGLITLLKKWSKREVSEAFNKGGIYKKTVNVLIQNGGVPIESFEEYVRRNETSECLTAPPYHERLLPLQVLLEKWLGWLYRVQRQRLDTDPWHVNACIDARGTRN